MEIRNEPCMFAASSSFGEAAVVVDDDDEALDSVASFVNRSEMPFN